MALLAVNAAEPWWRWSLVHELCEGEPDGTVEASGEKLWGALIAGQAIADSADATKLADTRRAEVQRVMRWLMRVVEEKNCRSWSGSGRGRCCHA